MKIVSRILLLSLTFVAVGVHSQESKSTNQETLRQQLALEQSTLLSDLHSLDDQSLNLSSLARASIKAEVADAAWDIDRQWSKKLLTKAYELTWPPEDDLGRGRDVPIGSQPAPPTQSDQARRAIRNRIVQIAAKDQAFADELIHSGVKPLGRVEVQLSYASLAADAWRNNDLDSAGRYLMQSAELDPSQIAAGFLIADIARNNREKADDLIVLYLQRLMAFPLSSRNDSLFRVYLVVARLIFPPPEVKPPAARVMRAYVTFVIQSMTSLEQREPGSLVTYRPLFLRAYPILKEYAPELASEFLTLEAKSRTPGSPSSVDAAAADLLKSRQEKQSKDISENETPTERDINERISKHEFVKARKLVDKLPDLADRERLFELINAKEALYLVGQNNILQARTLAEKLQRARSIQEVYVGLILKCIANKDDSLAQDLMIQAMKQLKSSNSLATRGPLDMPVTLAPTSRDIDPILDGMAKLTIAISSSSFDVALLGLGEIVTRANQSEIDTAQGRPGFDITIFKKLVPKDESRVRLAAESFKDPVRRLLSLAVINQWRASSISEREKALRANSKSAVSVGVKN